MSGAERMRRSRAARRAEPGNNIGRIIPMSPPEPELGHIGRIIPVSPAEPEPREPELRMPPELYRGICLRLHPDGARMSPERAQSIFAEFRRIRFVAIDP
jgi:hypothetical protein